MSGLARVAIWRDSWLPYSQTFVVDHVRSLTRYEPLTAGLQALSPEYVSTVDYLSSRKAGSDRIAKVKFICGGRRAFTTFLREERVSLVHAHFGPGAIRIRWAVRRASVPLVVTFHGFDVMAMPARGLKGWIYKRQLTSLVSMAALILPVSEFLKDELLRLGVPQDKVVVHYLGTSVSTPPVVPSFSDRLGVLFVGRLIPSKGAAELLRAVALSDKLSAVPVTIVGDGPELEGLRTFAADNGLNVKFVGAQPHDEVIRLMDAHRVFCLPSHRVNAVGPEAFGLVFAEAAMRGLPSVAFHEGGVSEAVSDECTGVLTASGDVAALAEGLRRLYTDRSLWESFSSSAVIIANKQFRLATQSERLERLYDEIVA